MSYGVTKQDLLDVLVKKTRELGRRVTSDDMRGTLDAIGINEYATNFGSFEEAASDAYALYKKEINPEGKSAVRLKVPLKQDRHKKQLGPDRTNYIVDQFVDMFIENDGEMPTQRQIKKNKFFSEDEVCILRLNGEVAESRIRKLAEEKAGRKFEKRKYVPAAPKVDVVVESEPTKPESKNEPEKQHPLDEELVESKEEEVVEMGETKGKTAARYSKEECLDMYRAASLEAGHLLCKTDVNALSKDGVFPIWDTLCRKFEIGWFLWHDLFDDPEWKELPFASNRIALLAESERKKLEEAGKIEPEPEGIELEPEIKESTEPEIEEPADPKPKDEDMPVNSEIEEKPEANNPCIGNSFEIPIQVFLPEGFNGRIAVAHGKITFTELTIEF